MRRFYLAVALAATSLCAQTQGAEQDARSYCEDAAKLMQLEGDEARAYIEQCIKAKQEEAEE